MKKILLLILSSTCSVATIYPAPFAEKQKDSPATITPAVDAEKPISAAKISPVTTIIPASKKTTSKRKKTVEKEVSQNSLIKKTLTTEKIATVTQQQCNSFKSIIPIVQSYKNDGYQVLILVDIDGTLLREDDTHAVIDPYNCVIINDFQKMPGVIVLGLTARDFEKYETTQNLLENGNINFAKPAKPFNFLREPSCLNLKECLRGYINGVIYARGKKDIALEAFINRNLEKISPNGKNFLKIIFIDNEQQYIDQVARALKQLNIDGNLFLFIEPQPIIKPQLVPTTITAPAATVHPNQQQ